MNKSIFSFSNPLVKTVGSHYQRFSKYVLLEYPRKEILIRYLNFLKKWDTSFMYFHTDKFFQEDLAKIQEYTKIILDNSSLFIRFLSDSIVLFDLAVYLKKYKNRLYFSLPIKDIESEQFLTFRELQNYGYNTYAMLEPTKETTVELFSKISPSLCESIWIKPQKDQIEIIHLVSKNFKQFEKKIFYLLIKEELEVEDDLFLKTIPNIEYLSEF